MSEAIEPKGKIEYDASVATSLNLRANAALQGVTDMVIDSPTMYELAGEELKAIKSLQRDVEEQRVAITGPLNAALRAVNDLFRAPKEYLEKAERTVKGSISGWLEVQERIALKAKQEADRLARIESERLAEIQRKADQEAREANDRAMAAQRAAEEAAAIGDAKALAQAQAEVLEQSERAESAQAAATEASMSAAVTTIQPRVTTPAKVAGISGQMRYSAEVTDLKALIEAVAAGKAPIQCLTADSTFLGQQARAFKRVGELFPGVVSKAERSISARAA